MDNKFRACYSTMHIFSVISSYLNLHTFHGMLHTQKEAFSAALHKLYDRAKSVVMLMELVLNKKWCVFLTCLRFKKKSVQKSIGPYCVYCTVYIDTKVKVKVKQWHYSPAQALSVPRGWGSQISRHSAHERGEVVSPTHWPPLPPRIIPGIHFC
jgi:hypothetical protein